VSPPALPIVVQVDTPRSACTSVPAGGEVGDDTASEGGVEGIDVLWVNSALLLVQHRGSVLDTGARRLGKNGMQKAVITCRNRPDMVE
jgi:hypothetical protein